MPWCEGCDRFFNPSTLGVDGTCQQCGRFIASPDDEPEEAAGGRAPWHFYVLIACVVIYLGWRLLQGVDLAVRAIF